MTALLMLWDEPAPSTAVRPVTALRLRSRRGGTRGDRTAARAQKRELYQLIEAFGRGPQPEPDHPRDYYIRTRTWYAPAYVGSAIDECTKVLQANSDDAAAWYNRGVAYCVKRDFERAVEDLAKAIDLKPDNARAYNDRGVVHVYMSELCRAIEDFDQALELDPGNAATCSNRGVAYSLKGEYDRALDDFGRALQLDPGDGATLHNRGMAYYGKGDSKSAIRDFDKALHLKRDLPTPQTKVEGLSTEAEVQDE